MAEVCVAPCARFSLCTVLSLLFMLLCIVWLLLCSTEVVVVEVALLTPTAVVVAQVTSVGQWASL